MKRLVFFLGIGLGGAAILIALGVWQIQRLGWKQEILAEIAAQIEKAPVALPADPDPVADKYLSVTAVGAIGDANVRVLVSKKNVGAGYRIITPFKMADRTVLLDRGFVRQSGEIPTVPAGLVKVTGNLHWPQETDSYTPDPDLTNNIWFARDVALMASALDTAPILIVAREKSFSDPGVTPFPVDTAGIPNDHLQYAITWFSLAAIWLIISLYFVRPKRTPKNKES